jgi:hypothetical protein
VTVFDLITEALAIYGEYAAGESLDASSVQSLLFTLNGAIDGLGAERLSIYSTSVLSYTTIAGKQSVHLRAGGGGLGHGGRGSGLHLARRRMLSNGGVELPIAIVNADEWAGIWAEVDADQRSLRRSGLSTGRPRIRSTFGLCLRARSLWRSTPRNRFRNSWRKRDTVSLPPGYQEFLTYDLAIKSSSKFGAPLPDWLPQAWREARTRIKERNYRAFDSRCDPALTQGSGRGVPSIDFYTGK